MKKFYAVLIAVIAVMLFTLSASAAVTASGSCGTGLTWTLGGTGTLTISGTGDMYNFDYRKQLSEYDYDEGTTYYNNPNYRVAEWDAYSAEITKVVINSGVTGIGNYAFRNFTAMTEISIPSSVVSIGSNAFTSCSALASIELPNGVTALKNDTFYKCLALADVSLPSNLVSIGSNAFYGCSSLADIDIPAGVTSIGSDAFFECTALKELVFPSGVTTVSSYICKNCTALVSVTLPTNALYIESEAFSGCVELETADMNGNTVLKTVNTKAFYNCGKLKALDLPDSVYTIGTDALYGCGSIEVFRIPEGVDLSRKNVFCQSGFREIIIPASAAKIGEHTFNACYNLRKVTFESNDNITSIGCHAFSSCTSLIEIDIPDSVTKMDEGAFERCTALTEVWLPASWSQSPETCYGAVKAYPYVSGPFDGCTALKTVHFDEQVTVIPQKALYGSGLEYVFLPDNIASYMDYHENQVGWYESFPNNTILACYAGTQTARTLGSRAQLTNMPIESIAEHSDITMTSGTQHSLSVEAVTESGKTVVNNYILFESDQPDVASVSPLGVITAVKPGLVRLTVSAVGGSPSVTFDVTVLPENVSESGTMREHQMWCLDADGVLTIGGSGVTPDYGTAPWQGFADRITAVTVNGGITELGNRSIVDCAYLTSVELPDSITYIGEQNFRNCASLTAIDLPASLNMIDEDAFKGCTGLTEVVFPDETEYIYSDAFDGCTALERISLPLSIKMISVYAFGDCTNLKDVTYAGTAVDKNYIESVGENYTLQNAEWHCVPRIVKSGELGGGVMWEVNDQGLLRVYGSGHIPSYMQEITYSTGGSRIEFLERPWEAYTSSGNIYPITRIVIEEGIKTIGDNAFSGITLLESVELPSGVTYIGEYAFKGCQKLCDITLPGIVNEIGSYAFGECAALTDIVFPNTLRTLGSNAFEYSGITEAVLPNGVTAVGDGCFRYCGALKKAVWPRGTTVIPANAFSHCTSLSEITIPSTVTNSEGYAFDSCRAISKVFIDNVSSWNTLCVNAREHFDALPNNAGNYTSAIELYVGNVLVESVTITADLIGDGAFRRFANIKSVYLPETVEIGWSAFSLCGGLQNVYYAGDIGGWMRNVIARDECLTDGRNLYLNGELLTDAVIPQDITYIRANAFTGLDCLQTVTLPESVTKVYSKAFDGCPNAVITLPDDINYMESDAFGTKVQPKQLICSAGTETSRTLYTKCGCSFTDPMYPDLLICDPGDKLCIIAYNGASDKLVIPDGFGSFTDTEHSFRSLSLPATLSAEDSFTLTAERVDIPDGVEELGTLTLGGVNKIRIPASVTGFDGFTCTPPADGVTTVYCNMESDAEMWALLNSCEIAYLDTEIWDPVLSYVGEAVSLDVGGTHTFTAEDFSISPLPDHYTGILTITCEGMAADGMKVTAESAGDFAVVAEMDGYTVEVPVHVFAPVSVLAMDAPELVPAGDSFEVSISNVEPEGTSGIFIWNQDGEDLYTGIASGHTFNAPRDSAATVITVTSSSGYSTSVTVTIPQTLTYVGDALALEIGETYVLTGDDFELAPVPEGYIPSVAIGGEGLTVDGMAVTAKEAGDFVLTASAMGRTAEIPVHVYRAAESVAIEAPALVMPENTFEATLNEIVPDGTSGLIVWSQDGVEMFADNAASHTFTAPNDSENTVIRATAPSGVYGEVSVIVPQTIEAPFVASKTAEFGEYFEIGVTINGTTFVNDPVSYQTVTIPSGSATKIALDENGVKAIGVGRAVFTVRSLDGQDYNFVVTVEDTKHASKTHFDKVEPTCTEPGTKACDRCDICGKLFDENGDETDESALAIAPTGHTDVTDAGYAATCTEHGLSDGLHCSVCNTVLIAQRELPALTHDITTHEAKAATCTEIGWNEYETCSRCDYTTYREIAPLGHDLIRHDAKRPTSTEPGWYEYDTCSRCDYSTYLEIPVQVAETVTIDDLKYGEAAMKLAMSEEPITATLNGTVYSFDEFPGSFKNEVRLYGGNTHAVTEVTVPGGKIAEDDNEMYLGTVRIDDYCFAEDPGTLRILAGNRETGVYAASAEITLNGAYEEGIYLPRDSENMPVLVDRIYFLTYTMDGETVHRAMSLYIDYEGIEAGHEPIETSLEHINDEPAPVISYYDDSHSEAYNIIADTLRMENYLEYDFIFWALDEGEPYQDLVDLFDSYGKTFPRSIAPTNDDNRRITSLGSHVKINGLHYGNEAWQLFEKGEANEFELGGRVYSLSDWGGRFDGNIELYGGNTLSVIEVTVPENIEVDSNLLIGTYTLDVERDTALYILDGNRVTGEYDVQGPIMLTESYSEDLYADWVNGRNRPTDRIYLSVTEQNGMMRCRAMSIYIDYEDCGTDETDIDINEGSALVLPPYLREIGEEAFTGVAADRIIVSEGIETIGARAFADSALKILVLPDSLEYIDPTVLEGCAEMKAIVCSPDNAAAVDLAEYWGLTVVYR